MHKSDLKENKGGLVHTKDTIYEKVLRKRSQVHFKTE